MRAVLGEGREAQPLVVGQLLIGGSRLREERLPPEPCAPTNAEARLHGTVFFAVLPRRPDEHAADEDERDEHHHENDDLCSRHCHSFTAKPRLGAEPLSEHPLAPRSLGATRTHIFEPPQAEGAARSQAAIASSPPQVDEGAVMLR